MPVPESTLDEAVTVVEHARHPTVISGAGRELSTGRRGTEKLSTDPGSVLRDPTGYGRDTHMTPWWRDAVVYQVYPRSFADGSGDGFGDIAGLRSRLPYLVALGVDAVWINPWYPSPQADNGYDVADYRDVDPVFGTLAEAEALLAECAELGIRVVLDIVPNHTSDRHPWFQAALAAKPGSPERDRYVFRPGRGDEPPNNWISAFGGPAWQRVPDGEWYLHMFTTPEQPDLNWENAEVRADFEKTLRFWFDRGVAGFRIDVAHGLVKDQTYPDTPPGWTMPVDPPFVEVHPAWDQEGVHDVYRAWRRVGDEYPGQKVFVGEVWVAPQKRMAKYLRPGELHSAFNFDLLIAPWEAGAFRDVIEETITVHGDVGAPPAWVLGNHDVVRPVTRYGRAVGRQLAQAGAEPVDVALGLRRARAAALLTTALPGSVYIYQGEELGLPEVEDLPDEALADPIWTQSGHTRRGRDGCRVPLPWSGTAPPFGFTTGEPWLPLPERWRDLTVEVQRGDPASTWELYAAALRIRKAHPALGDGSLSWLPARDGVLAFARDPGFVCVLNMSTAPVELPEHDEVLLSSGPLTGELPPDQAVWLSC
jgi:alpha-glucosidase